jgi:hypothetical protein
MNAKELQETKDAEYAKSLGYDTDIFHIENEEVREEELEYEMTNLFDYKEKTKKYFEAID